MRVIIAGNVVIRLLLTSLFAFPPVGGENFKLFEVA